MARYSKEDQARAREALKELKPGDWVYTILRSRSRSGMYRRISLVTMPAPGEVRCWDWAAAVVMGEPVNRGNKEGIGVGGCGMDMGFNLVMNLGYALFPNGYTCTGKNCPSADHSNGDRNYRRHHHSSGGYAFRHRWL